MSGFEISRSTTRSENTSAILDDPILDDPILDDNPPVLQPKPKFIVKSMQKIKDFSKWLLDYIPPKPKLVGESLQSFKNLIKKLHNKRDTSF